MALTEQAETFWVAWAAGFIDGEGCIRLAKSFKRPKKRGSRVEYALRVQVVNTDIRALHRLKEMFGGVIYIHTKAGHQTWKPSWVWTAQSLVAERCLLRIMPWLAIKREQAELAIRSRQYIGSRGRKRSVAELDGLEWIHRELSQMKLRPESHTETPGQRHPSDDRQEKSNWRT